MAAFATAVPDLTIILHHMGDLLRVGPHANRDDAVFTTIPRPGFDGYIQHEPISSAELEEAMAPVLTHGIEQCGPNLSMFASNFLVDKQAYSYNILYSVSNGYPQTVR